jgi:hypothetical protein
VIRPNDAYPVSDTSWLVRYRFASPDELYRHLRLGSGLFVPERSVPRGRGLRVIVEIDFPGAGDRPLLHGHVRERGVGGVWLEAPSVRATARWVPGPDSPRRLSRRLACDLFVEVKATGGESWLCRAMDLSEGGVRLATGSLETGVVGDEVELVLLDREVAPAEVRARLSWVRNGEAGLCFLGAPLSLARLLGVVEARWSSVQEIDHDPSCACARAA